MSAGALGLLEQLERRLAQEPTAEEADAGRATPRVYRLWLIARLCGEDADVHLLAYRLVELVARPTPQRMAAWLAELGRALAPGDTDRLEPVGELSRVLTVLSRLLEAPVEVRAAALDRLTPLSMGAGEREPVGAGRCEAVRPDSSKEGA